VNGLGDIATRAILLMEFFFRAEGNFANYEVFEGEVQADGTFDKVEARVAGNKS